ncbi:MAG: type VII secretion protein EccE, partial [Mycobacterium sp.]
LWGHDIDATVLTVRLVARGGRPQLAAWVRYHSDGRLPKEASAGLNRLTGRQLAAVRASLPAPTTRTLLAVPSRPLYDDDELVLSVGQLRESSAGVPAAQ